MADEKYISQLGIPDEHFRLVGIIAGEWERLEFILEWAVAEIGFHNPIDVALLTINLTFTAKIEIILTHASALKDEHPGRWKEITDSVQRIRRLNNLRNTYIHARWIPSDNDDEIPEISVARTAQGKLELENRPIPLAELAKTAAEIRAAADEFVKIMNSYGLLTVVPQGTNRESAAP